MALYTLVMDFDGGTYICQAHSDDRQHAPFECIKAWDTQGVEHIISRADKAELLSQLDEEYFVPVAGLNNVWCGQVTLSGVSATLNLIRTDDAH
ncbi:hypothetical protein NBRC116494_02720 [Aurantivibrio plasticivorans]